MEESFYQLYQVPDLNYSAEHAVLYYSRRGMYNQNFQKSAGTKR
jgi:hypothetical protein